jgi:hypothetical protein
MKKIAIAIVLFIAITSCNRVKSGAKDALHATGETVGKVGGDLVNSVSEGAKQAMQCEVVVSDDLKNKGLQTGKINFASDTSATDNILVAYLIFNNTIDQNIGIKVFDEKGLEYGRTSLKVKGNKSTAGYFNFVFDKRINLESKSKFIIE